MLSDFALFRTWFVGKIHGEHNMMFVCFGLEFADVMFSVGMGWDAFVKIKFKK